MWIIVFGLLYGFARMLKNQQKTSTAPKKIPKGSLAEGINILDGVVLVKSRNTITAYEAKCTHLGCQLKHSENGIIRCSCHGSAFNDKGEAVKGPAFKSLTKLSIKLANDSQMLEIQMP